MHAIMRTRIALEDPNIYGICVTFQTFQLACSKVSTNISVTLRAGLHLRRNVTRVLSPAAHGSGTPPHRCRPRQPAGRRFIVSFIVCLLQRERTLSAGSTKPTCTRVVCNCVQLSAHCRVNRRTSVPRRARPARLSPAITGASPGGSAGCGCG